MPETIEFSLLPSSDPVVVRSALLYREPKWWERLLRRVTFGRWQPNLRVAMFYDNEIRKAMGLPPGDAICRIDLARGEFTISEFRETH